MLQKEMSTRGWGESLWVNAASRRGWKRRLLLICPTTFLCGAAGDDLAFCLEVCLQFQDDLQQTKRPEGDEEQTTSQGEAELHSRNEVSLGGLVALLGCRS